MRIQKLRIYTCSGDGRKAYRTIDPVKKLAIAEIDSWYGPTGQYPDAACWAEEINKINAWDGNSYLYIQHPDWYISDDFGGIQLNFLEIVD